MTERQPTTPHEQESDRTRFMQWWKRAGAPQAEPAYAAWIAWLERGRLAQSEKPESNAAPQGAGKTVWLIERGQRLGHAPTIWFVSRNTLNRLADMPTDEWTEDASKAQRFSSREHAKAEADRLFGRYSGDPKRLVDVTEHVFLDAASLRANCHTDKDEKFSLADRLRLFHRHWINLNETQQDVLSRAIEDAEKLERDLALALDHIAKDDAEIERLNAAIEQSANLEMKKLLRVANAAMNLRWTDTTIAAQEGMAALEEALLALGERTIAAAKDTADGLGRSTYVGSDQ